MNKEQFESVVHACGDLKSPIDNAYKFLLEQWTYDLYARSPGPAILENGVLKPTDLDLACFLSALCDRGAVINIPSYTSRRAKVEREGERIVSAQNRHGRCVKLASDQDAFSFSITIDDANVITSHPEDGDSVGALRSFMLVDVDGEWHGGWREIEFNPSARENAFLSDRKLWTENKVVFKNFVHPHRWSALYGRSYLASKLMLDRLRAEAEWLFAESQRLFSIGISPEYDRNGYFVDKAKSKKVGQDRPIKVSAFEVEVDGFAPVGSFPAVADNGKAHGDALLRRRYLIYTMAPRLRFSTRATEYAFYKCGGSSEAPSWVSKDFNGWSTTTPPGTRTAWTTARFEAGLSLRHRCYTKTERVAV